MDVSVGWGVCVGRGVTVSCEVGVSVGSSVSTDNCDDGSAVGKAVSVMLWLEGTDHNPELQADRAIMHIIKPILRCNFDSIVSLITTNNVFKPIKPS